MKVSSLVLVTFTSDWTSPGAPTGMTRTPPGASCRFSASGTWLPLAAARIAREVAGLIAGTNDLAADLRLPPDAGRAPLQMALQTIVLAGRGAGIPVFDGVFNGLNDPDGFREQADEGRRLGVDGKSLIHPDQIALCHQAIAPSEAEIDRARRLLDAATGGAERFDDQMIERMHVEAAERLLARL